MAARHHLPLAETGFGLRWRLMLAMGLLAAVVLTIGLFAPAAVGRLRASVHQAVEVDGLMSQLASEVAVRAHAARRYDQSFFLHLDSATQRYVYRLRWDSAIGELGEAIEAFRTAATTAEDQRQARVWAVAFELYRDGFREVAGAIEAGEVRTFAEADRRMGVYEENIETLTELSIGFMTRKQAIAARSVDELNATGHTLNVTLGSLAVLGIVVAIGWSLYFPGRLTRPLGTLSAAATRLAGGDLAARTGVRGGDEIGTLGQAFDQMAATIEQRTSDLQAQFVAAEAARYEAEAARAQVAEQLATIAAQRSVMQEMSVPILPVSRGVLVMPVVGALDSERIGQAQERALRAVETSRAAFLIIDITGVPVVDTAVAQGLIGIVQAANLLGARSVLVGIRPEVAQTVVGLGIDLGGIVTRATLEAGVSYTIQAANGTPHKGQ